jgi:hypothetical protein
VNIIFLSTLFLGIPSKISEIQVLGGHGFIFINAFGIGGTGFCGICSTTRCSISSSDTALESRSSF